MRACSLVSSHRSFYIVTCSKTCSEYAIRAPQARGAALRQKCAVPICAVSCGVGPSSGARATTQPSSAWSFLLIVTTTLSAGSPDCASV
eukprot:4523870-Prymnesium_polylepis.1